MIVAKDAEIMPLLQEEHLADPVWLVLGLQLDLRIQLLMSSLLFTTISPRSSIFSL